MREDKRKGRPASRDAAEGGWREELLANALEVYMGISRLLTAIQYGPPQSSSPRTTGARRGTRRPKR